MKTWTEYKATFPDAPDIFACARAGDLRGLADLLTAIPDLELNVINHRGYSPLMLAVYNGQQDFCEALLRGGADVNSTDSMGNTVLMAAAYKGNREIFELLMRFGADANRVNRSGMTAHDWAIAFGRKDIAALLAARDGSVRPRARWKTWLRLLILPFRGKSNSSGGIAAR